MTHTEESNLNNKELGKAISSTIVCPSCQKYQSSTNKFCEKCGQNFASEKIKSNRKIKRNIRTVRDTEEKRKYYRNINDGRILILVVTVASFAFYLLKIDYFDAFILNVLLSMEDSNLINYFKMLSYIPLGIGIIYLVLFFWSFKNIFSSLIISFSIFLIETGLVVFFSGVRLHPLYLIYKGVVIVFLIIAIRASIKLNIGSKKPDSALK